MKNLIMLLASLISMPAFSYDDGIYKCKNSNNLPDNVYTIRTIKIAAGNESLPYIEGSRFFFTKPSEPNSPISEAKVKGLATVFSNETSEILALGALRLEFTDGKLFNCEKAP